MIEIKEVLTKKDIKDFTNYPIKLYKGCPYYVPSILEDEIDKFNPKKNASLRTCQYKGFLAYKDGKLVGRIGGIINTVDNEITKKKCIRFTRIECIDDIEVFKALFKAVANFGKENGLDTMHGPWGFTDQDREGMLTEGFEERSTYSTNYYYPYFHENLEKLGFEDESKWVEMQFNIPDKVDERAERIAKRVLEKYKVREVADKLSVKQIIKQYGTKLFDTINQAYGHLDGYVPLDDAMQKDLLSTIAMIVNTRYISVLVDEKEDVAAFGICLPSICDAIQKHKGRVLPFGIFDLLKAINSPKELEMALIGVRSEYKNLGLNSAVISRIMKNIIEDGIEKIDSNLMLETNHSILQQWKFADYEIVKRVQTYKIDIDKALQF